MIAHWPTIISATTVGIAHCLLFALPQASMSSTTLSDTPAPLTVELNIITVAQAEPVAPRQPKPLVPQPLKRVPPKEIELEKVVLPDTEAKPDMTSKETECAQPQEPTEAISETEVTELSEPIQPVTQAIQWQKPVFKKPPTPAHYPRRARQRKQQGTVLMHVHIDQLGDVIQSKVATSSGYTLLDEAAQKAVFEWEFVPGTQTENQIGAWIEVPVHFILHQNNKG